MLDNRKSPWMIKFGGYWLSHSNLCPHTNEQTSRRLWSLARQCLLFVIHRLWMVELSYVLPVLSFEGWKYSCVILTHKLRFARTNNGGFTMKEFIYMVHHGFAKDWTDCLEGCEAGNLYESIMNLRKESWWVSIVILILTSSGIDVNVAFSEGSRFARRI